MASLNKVILIGNLGKDPEVRYTPANLAICSISIATARSRKNDSGERVEETEWHRIVFFDRLAEIAGEYLKKGRSIYVEGRLRTRKYEKDGRDVYTTEVVAEQMQMLGPRDDNDGQRERTTDRANGHSGSAQRPPAQRSNGQRSSAPPTRHPHSGTGFDEMDDDIPF